MASKKDLQDAQSFSRRRLLTAFTSGAPGGKELEPANPMRAVIAGVVLAAMVVLGGVFYGYAKPGLGDDWENNTLVLVSDTGARYVTYDGTLYPVANATSARLFVPAGEFSVITTSSSEIADIPIGASIGIIGAPDDVPAADDLLGSGWLACPTTDGTAVTLSADTDATAADGAMLAESDGTLYVIADGLRYQVSEVESDAVLRAVGLAEATPVPVEARWLDLFDQGTTLAPLIVDDAGEAVEGTDLLAGSIIQAEGSDDRYVLTADGELAPMSEIAYQLYLLGTAAQLRPESTIAPSQLKGLENAPAVEADDWPADVLTPLTSTTACALLGRNADGSATTTLATTDTAPSEAGVTVGPRTGALVAAGGEGDQATREVFLVDETGTAYAVPDPDEDTLARLGYTSDDVVTLPRAWMQFFGSGPDLTTEAAGAIDTATASASAEPTASAETGGTTADDSLAGLTSLSAASTTCEAGTYAKIDEDVPALAMLQADDVAARATGAGVTIAVVDSGIDSDNAHLSSDSSSVITDAVDLVGDGRGEVGRADAAGHGTAVAGVIAARAIDGSSIVGLAPDAALQSVRVYAGTDDDSVEAGYGPTVDRLAEGIVWAVDHDATIINVSLSTDEDAQMLRDAVAYAVDNDVLIVASAGNRSTTENTEDSVRYPAAYDGVLGVAAANGDGTVSDNSIHGSHVDVMAPGQYIYTATTGGTDCIYASTVASPSYATAYASAAAALVAQAHPDETPAQWIYRLEATAIRASLDTRTDESGWGMIQPFDAITLVAGADTRGPQNPDVGSQQGAAVPAQQPLVAEPSTSPLAEARTVLLLAGLVAAIALGLLGIAVVRRRSTSQEFDDAEREETGDAAAQRGGLLERQRSATTRILD